MEEKRILGFCSTPDFSGNAKALYEQLKERKLKNYELIWIVRDENIKKRLQAIGIDVVCSTDSVFEQKFKKIQIMFITHDEFIKKKLPTQTFISLWHGFGPKRAGLLTKGRTIYENESSFAKVYGKKLDYLITPSELALMVFNAIYDCGVEKIKVFPYNRNRYLFENHAETINKIIDRKMEDFDKVILYAPTFRKGIGREEGDFNKQNILNLEEYQEEKLIEYLKRNNYLLILQLHPSEENTLNYIGNEKNIVILKQDKLEENLLTINQVLNCVDILITDYSSIYVDFLLLDRPVIFMNKDYEKFKEDRGIFFDSQEFWCPGPITNTIEELIDGLEKLKEIPDYYQKERRIFNQIANGGYNQNYDAIIDDFILKLDVKLKIPKKIHYFASQNQRQKENVEKWKNTLVEYEFYEWKKEDTKSLQEKYKIDETEILIKMAILEEHGGVFLDTDIQVLNDIEPLLFADEIVIKGNYNECMHSVLGAAKGDKILLDFIKDGWLNIDKNGLKVYDYKDVFVSDSEQWRIGKEDFKDKDKFFNNTNLTLKNKIGRSIKYGFNIDNRGK